MQTTNKITLVIPTLICLHTAKPYILEIRRRSIAICYYIGDELQDDQIKAVDPSATSIQRLTELAARYPILKVLHELLRITVTPMHFSAIYPRWLQQRLSTRGIFARGFMNLLARRGPKLDARKVNSMLERVIRPFLNNPFETRKLIYFSLAPNSFLFCARNLEVNTILESWDHPGKAPIGHLSRSVFVWNKALEEDWQNYQGPDPVYLSFPIKLGYALERRKNATRSPSEHRLMYAMTFGASSEAALYTEELQLVDHLCSITADTGTQLVLKPKPNSQKGELDQFKRYSHVRITEYTSNAFGSHYDLTDRYNAQRLSDLDQCDIVVNVGTTFALDAAAYGCPVVQLVFDAVESFPGLSKLRDFPHLARHLYENTPREFVLRGTGIHEQLNFLAHHQVVLELARQKQRQLAQWLSPVLPRQAAISSVVTQCLCDTEH